MCESQRREFLVNSLAVLGTMGAGSAFAQQTDKPKIYVCPPCGCARDGDEFSQPGNCAACGMPLIEKGSQSAPRSAEPRPKVAVLIFEGVQIIDFAAPYEVFGQAGYEVFTVGATKTPLTTSMRLSVTPMYGFADAPRPDVLLVPGGNIATASADAAVLDWIRARSAESKFTLSVCNGAIILARAGLLDGLKATTFYQAIDQLRQEHPKVVAVSDRRFVDNGRIITSAGLSAGIDVAARLVALNMEYDWKPDTTYARASFADYPFWRMFGSRLRLGLPDNYGVKVESTQGDRTTWDVVWRIATEPAQSATQIADAIEASIARDTGLLQRSQQRDPDDATRSLSFQHSLSACRSPRRRRGSRRVDVQSVATERLRTGRKPLGRFVTAAAVSTQLTCICERDYYPNENHYRSYPGEYEKCQVTSTACGYSRRRRL
jgi:putative intracellular protease/amidase